MKSAAIALALTSCGPITRSEGGDTAMIFIALSGVALVLVMNNWR